MTRIGVVIVSDRAARGERADACLEVIRRWADAHGHEVGEDRLVPDDGAQIEDALRAVCSANVDVVLTSGGTGLAPRDVTPEATRRVIDRATPGLDEMLRRVSAERTPMAALSRGVSGLAGRTLIVNLPGSPRAVEEYLQMMQPILPHAVEIAHGADHDAPQTNGHPHAHTHAPAHNTVHPARRELLERDDALARIAARLPELGTTYADIADAAGCVCAEDVRAQVDEPAFARSAMDGYAFPARLASSREWLRVVGESHAGDPPREWSDVDGVVRILTGAPLGPGLVGVIPQEDVEVRETDGAREVRFVETPSAGDCVRPAGHSLPRGALLVTRGTMIGAATRAVLTGAGEARVHVVRAPRVVCVSTGDEVVPLLGPGQALPPGRIFDTNSPLLETLLADDGAVACGTLGAADSLDRTTAALARALDMSDVVLTMGGISVGDRDHVARALELLDAEPIVHGVNFRPGRPFAAFRAGEKMVFALPGNPLSVLATYVLFVRPQLDRLMQRTPAEPACALLRSAVQNPGGRWWAALAELRMTGATLGATVDTSSLDSGSLLPLTRATGFVLLPPHAACAPGDVVQAFPLVRGSII